MILRAIGFVALCWFLFYLGTRWGNDLSLKRAVRQCEKACRR